MNKWKKIEREEMYFSVVFPRQTQLTITSQNKRKIFDEDIG
jgi:hypothetical protein